MNVKIKKLDEHAVTPIKTSDFAAGMDVTASSIEKISDDFVICYLGFALQPPINYKVMIVPRSSITKTNWVMQNSPGIGDPDYTGMYQIRFRAIPNGVIIVDGQAKLTYPKFPYQIGDRIGQIFLQEIIDINFDVVQELNPTERGEGGFGHSGKK